MAQPYVGEIRLFAGNFAPAGWMFCDGQLLPIWEYETLFQLIGTTYGGDGASTFALPDLRSRVPLHQGNGFVLAETGGSEDVTLTVNQIPSHSHTPIAAAVARHERRAGGAHWASSGGCRRTRLPHPNTTMHAAALNPPEAPSRTPTCCPTCASTSSSPSSASSRADLGGGHGQPFLSEIRMMSPSTSRRKGWALCNGQLLPINQNQALFSLLGTTYGGDGRVNFALPDLRGRAPIHVGAGYTLGRARRRGRRTRSRISELPAHTPRCAREREPRRAPATPGRQRVGERRPSAVYGGTAEPCDGAASGHQHRRQPAAREHAAVPDALTSASRCRASSRRQT